MTGFFEQTDGLSSVAATLDLSSFCSVGNIAAALMVLTFLVSKAIKWSSREGTPIVHTDEFSRIKNLLLTGISNPALWYRGESEGFVKRQTLNGTGVRIGFTRRHRGDVWVEDNTGEYQVSQSFSPKERKEIGLMAVKLVKALDEHNEEARRKAVRAKFDKAIPNFEG